MMSLPNPARIPGTIVSNQPAAKPASWLLPSLVTVLTAAFVAVILGHRAVRTGLQCDELLLVRAVDLGPIGGLMTPGSSHPPLVRWLLAPFADLSSPDWLLRLPSVLASIAAVVVWSRILRRMVPDRMTALLLLPAMGLNATFLALGYQCLPYGLLMLLASLHCLSWFWLLENPGRRAGTVFVLSGVLAAWTHFYGVNLLIADQLIWAVLLLKGTASRRTWLVTTLATFLLVLPLAPVALYYMNLERPYAIVQIFGYAGYFLAASALIFSETTFFGMPTPLPAYILWYAAALALLWKAWSPRGGRSDAISPESADTTGVLPLYVAAVVCGIFLAGFPAMQVHSIFSGKAMWERYTVLGVWIHLPMMVMLIYWVWGPKPARAVTAAALCLGVAGFLLGSPRYTRDYRPVVSHIRAHQQPGDAFFAQDMDFWIGAGHFDRLWFDRYVQLEMPILSGPPMLRAEIYAEGLPLGAADRSIGRIWVYSHLFQEPWLSRMPTTGWKLQELRTLGRNYPLALFVREEPPEAMPRESGSR